MEYPAWLTGRINCEGVRKDQLDRRHCSWHLETSSCSYSLHNASVHRAAQHEKHSLFHFQRPMCWSPNVCIRWSQSSHMHIAHSCMIYGKSLQQQRLMLWCEHRFEWEASPASTNWTAACTNSSNWTGTTCHLSSLAKDSRIFRIAWARAACGSVFADLPGVQCVCSRAMFMRLSRLIDWMGSTANWKHVVEAIPAASKIRFIVGLSCFYFSAETQCKLSVGAEARSAFSW